MRQCKRARTRQLFAVVTRDRDRIAKLFAVPAQMLEDIERASVRWQLKNSELMAALDEASERFREKYAKWPVSGQR
jgi:hypothetical protein